MNEESEQHMDAVRVRVRTRMRTCEYEHMKMTFLKLLHGDVASDMTAAEGRVLGS